MRLRKLMWMGMGAAGAYLFDPERGRSRRTEVKQRINDTVGQKLSPNMRDKVGKFTGSSSSPQGGRTSPPAAPNGMAEPETTLIIVEDLTSVGQPLAP